MTSISDRFSLDGKVALITGATRGIGAGIATAFAATGATVWVAGRSIDQAALIADGLPNAHAVALDVNDAASVKSAIMALRKGSGKLDILVNNAGIMRPAMIATSTEADLVAMMDTNIKGSFLCAQLAARLMAGKKTGSIINLTSIMGCEGATGFAAYSSTKAAVIGMTKAMAKELAPHNVRVNALAPGFVETDLTAGLDEASRMKALSNIGMARFGSVEDIASAAVFLASDAASYVTGQVLGVDGAMQA